MAEELETIKHYDTLDEADRAREYLEDENLKPVVIEEAHQRDTDTGVYALKVPDSQAEEAERLLDELPPVEEEEAVETLEDWEEESEEVRETFEQT
jgi:hypothetical protein